jgi:hypothetical protein
MREYESSVTDRHTIYSIAAVCGVDRRRGGMRVAQLTPLPDTA